MTTKLQRKYKTAEELGLDEDDVTDIVYDDLPDDWELAQKPTIYTTSRWSKHYKCVLKAPDGCYYRLCWSQGATEYQDEQPFEDGPPEFYPVKPEEYTAIRYVPV